MARSTPADTVLMPCKERGRLAINQLRKKLEPKKRR